MVSFADVIENNNSLLSPGSGPVAALVGGTNGIGLSALHALLKHTSTPTVYLVGRDSARLSNLIATVQPLNTSAKIHPIICEDLTLVASAQKAAEEIVAHGPERLDMLIMTPGYLYLGSDPDYSSEGIDKLTCIRYHARMRILMTLLPLLQRAPSPRVVTVLAAGQEGTLRLDDLAMTKPGTFGPIYSAGAATCMMTLFGEHLIKQPGNEKLVFVHIYPGLVDTGLKLQAGPWILRAFVDVIMKVAMKVMGTTPAEAGERVLFAATSGRFRRLATDSERERAKGSLVQVGSDGVLGSGVYAVLGDSSVVKGAGNKNLVAMRAEDAAQKVADYTMAEFARISS